MRWYFLVFDVLVFCLFLQMTPAKIASADENGEPEGHIVTVTLHSRGKTLAVGIINALAPNGTADTDINFGGGKSITSNTNVKNSYGSIIYTGLSNGDGIDEFLSHSEPFGAMIGVSSDNDGISTFSIKTKTDYNSASLDADVQHANGYGVAVWRSKEDNTDGYYSEIYTSSSIPTSTLSVHAEAIYNQPRTYIHGTGYAAHEVDVKAYALGTDDNDSTCNNYFEATGEAKNNPAPWAHAVSIPQCAGQH
jgi:hypothetical protein